MTLTRPPVAVLVVAAAYLAVGIIGFVAHVHDLLAVPSEGVWIELTELLVVAHGILAMLIGWLLFRQHTTRWFRQHSAVIAEPNN